MTSVPEVIAHLDDFERDLMSMAMKVREYRHMLFETLDKDPDALVA